MTSVRPQGMGGAFTGWATDINALIYNPAGLDTIEKKAFGAGYNRLAEDISQQTGCTTEECIIKMGKILNVQKIISGSCGKLGAYYVLSLKITDVETSEILHTAKVSWDNLDPDTVDRKIQEVIGLLLK